MVDWWESSPAEYYWCEVTDRTDIGADLKCPQHNEASQDYWSYSLVNRVRPADVVFHYSTKMKAFVGASVAGAPLEERPILWAPHGTVGRSKKEHRAPQPGWWLPLYGYHEALQPLALDALIQAGEHLWVREWATKMETEHRTRLAIPFQRYGQTLRGAQAYLTKMPADFVRRWEQLEHLAEDVEPFRDALSQLPEIKPLSGAALKQGFKPKNDEPYLAVIRASDQVRTRLHERIVRQTGEWLQARGASVSNPHPRDLLVSALEWNLILEVKVTGLRNPIFAIREAVGQLLEYRYFLGPKGAQLGIILDTEPNGEQIKFVEDEVNFVIGWWSGNELITGPKSREWIQSFISSL